VKIPKLRLPAETKRRIKVLQIRRIISEAQIPRKRDEINKLLPKELWVTEEDLRKSIAEMYCDLITEEILKLNPKGFPPGFFDKYES